MGDFNIDVIKIGNNTTADAFVNQLLSSSFYPLITKPTRITERSATLIDNILANRLNNNNINGILFSDLSDHLPLFTVEQNIKVKSQNYTAKMKRNISKENIDKFVEKLEQIHWEELNQETDPSKAYDRFYSKLFAIYDNCIPMKKMSNKQRKLQKKPWLTKAIMKSLTIKNKLYKKTVKTPSSDNIQEYKRYRNKLSHIIRISKKRYYKEKFAEMHNNLKKTWELINEVINKRNSKKSLPNKFYQGNEEITDPVNIAETFNKYFVDVGPNLAQKIPKPAKPFKTYLGRTVSESFFVTPEQKLK